MRSVVMLVVAVFFGCFSLLAAAQDKQNAISVRQALQEVSPAAFEVVEEIEQERKVRLSDKEIRKVVRSKDFAVRLLKKMQTDHRYNECRILRCVLT